MPSINDHTIMMWISFILFVFCSLLATLLKSLTQTIFAMVLLFLFCVHGIEKINKRNEQIVRDI